MTPYYSDDLVTLYHGKFEEILPRLDLIDVDAIVTDPPYAETNLEWDRWPDGWPSIAAQYARSMWVFGSMRMFLDRRDEFGDWKLSQDIVWEKHNGSSLAADRFSRVHEHALHFYRGKWSEIRHEVPTTPDATPRAVRRKAKPAHHQGARGPSYYTSEDGGPRIMRSVMYHRSMHGRAINETEKPVPLVVPLVEYAVPPRGLVVDLFAGSSSTLDAARITGRRAIGIEQRESQCEKAADRLSSQIVFDLSGGVS
ncbi:DNA-methyltransferase [Nocardioides sp. PD653]|uniref:DNA-methyltransferase n=1 Tax=Nocardioides sp. PD653 TaxID=393303 RepID=UPI0009EFF8E3|nr:site-specific DNA-methyltransferase [Nocardioides sp. PD653]GAW54707.1 DNA modification methylase [Nocardioides sp. PD653]